MSSRMAKYLRQTCSLARVSRTIANVPVMNTHGELTYDTAITIPCRRERYIRDVEMESGSVLKSSYQYYTVIEIGMNDKLDNLVVLSGEEYTNSRGLVEGYRSVT